MTEALSRWAVFDSSIFIVLILQQGRDLNPLLIINTWRKLTPGADFRSLFPLIAWLRSKWTELLWREASGSFWPLFGFQLQQCRGGRGAGGNAAVVSRRESERHGTMSPTIHWAGEQIRTPRTILWLCSSALFLLICFLQPPLIISFLRVFTPSQFSAAAALSQRRQPSPSFWPPAKTHTNGWTYTHTQTHNKWLHRMWGGTRSQAFSGVNLLIRPHVSPSHTSTHLNMT